MKEMKTNGNREKTYICEGKEKIHDTSQKQKDKSNTYNTYIARWKNTNTSYIGKVLNIAGCC
jgi:hypothetical protein